MKLPLALLAAALLLPVGLTHAAAQAPPAAAPDDAVRLLDDKVGDVKVSAGGSDQGAQDRWAAADLKALDVKESPDQVTFILTVGSLTTSDEAPILEDVQYSVGFRHLDQVYRATIDRRVLPGATQAFGYVEAYDPARQSYDQVTPFADVAMDNGAGALSLVVDRDLLVDREGDAPHPEVPLTDWNAQSHGFFASNFRLGDFCPTRTSCVSQPLPDPHDAMPDAGNGTTPLVPRFGIAQTGHARLFSQSPTRASNGEATTIVYQVEAVNRAGGNESFSLDAVGVPAGWAVRLPASRISVPGNGSVTLPVLASIPFAHQHGTYQKFVVEMQSLSDPHSTGRIQLGVRFSNPPQPAGHHNALWLHAASAPGQTGNPAADGLIFGNGGLYMNALDTDPLDSHLDVPANNCGSDLVPPQTIYCWFIPLRPQLELGLDFDLTRTGHFSVPVKTTLPLQGAVIQGSLLYEAPQEASSDGFSFGRFESLTLANLVPRPAVDVPPNSAGTILTADIVPTPDGDYVPYRKGATLYLEVDLVATGAQLFGGSIDQAVVPSIQAGGTLTELPLNEYHDLVSQVFSSNSTLQLLADGPQDRATNPGKTLLYNLTLQNTGAAGAFNLELNGTHLSWARILSPGDQVHLAAGETTPVRVAVHVPIEADKGDTADLVLSATSASNLNLRSLARLYTTVDTGKQYPDEAGLLDGAKPTKKTPGFETALLAPAIVALAALARRKLH